MLAVLIEETLEVIGVAIAIGALLSLFHVTRTDDGALTVRFEAQAAAR